MARRYVRRSRASPLSPASSSIEPAIVVFAARCWASTSPFATSRKLADGGTDPHARTTQHGSNPGSELTALLRNSDTARNLCALLQYAPRRLLTNIPERPNARGVLRRKEDGR